MGGGCVCRYAMCSRLRQVTGSRDVGPQPRSAVQVGIEFGLGLRANLDSVAVRDREHGRSALDSRLTLRSAWPLPPNPEFVYSRAEWEASLPTLPVQSAGCAARQPVVRTICGAGSDPGAPSSEATGSDMLSMASRPSAVRTTYAVPRWRFIGVTRSIFDRG